jgi:uncharacterized protein YndB with AHSA1/START domain
VATIRKERVIDVSPEAAWDALRDWAGLRERLVPGFVAEVRLDGDDRIVTFDNEMTVRERRVSSTDEDRRLVWTVVDGPFEHYNGAAQVLPDTAGRTRFVWLSDLLPDENAAAVEEMMERGINTIKRTLEATGIRA